MVFANAKEFAEITGYPLKRIKRLIKQGEIPFEQIGRRYCINVQLGIAALNGYQSEVSDPEDTVARRPDPPARGGSAKERVERLMADLKYSEKGEMCGV